MAGVKDYADSTGRELKPLYTVAKVHGQIPLAASARHSRDRLWRPLRDSIVDAYQKQDYPLGYSAGLDGLRGFMTLGIMAAHIDLAALPGIPLFMDIFYVMSGYFITGLLIKDGRRHGHMRFLQFYHRRFCRLLPPLATMTAIFLLLSYLFFPDFKKRAIDAAIGFFYAANWWRAFEWPGLFYMGHTWSLAVEEQFYLLWPFTFLVFWHFLGISWRTVGAILTLAAAICTWRFWLTWHGATFQRPYNGFDTRADALMLGCALAVALTLMSLDFWSTFDRFLKKLAWPVAIIALTLTLFVFDYRGRLYYYVGILSGGVLGTMLVMILIRPLNTGLHRILERRGLTFLGRIFYAMYLWHFPIFMIFEHDFGWPMWLRAIIGFPLTIVIATLSYVLIERHFMRTKGRVSGMSVDQIAGSAPVLLKS